MGPISLHRNPPWKFRVKSNHFHKIMLGEFANPSPNFNDGLAKPLGI